MKNKHLNQKRINHLAERLTKITDAKIMKNVLRDLCTITELEAIADRLWIIPFIQAGKSYRDIHQLTGVSITTIGRVAHHCRDGHGGYQYLFNKQ